MPHVELPQAEFKVVMLGDSNAGKTSLVLRFAEGYYREGARSSTVGAFFITKRIQTSNGITCKIQIWDTAGQKQFRAMAPMYYKNAAAAIVCYDVTNPESYTVMREWLDELHRNVPVGSIVIAIAATKSDLVHIAPTNTLVPAREAEKLASAMGAIFVDTSAKDNSNVNVLFQRVAERVLQFRDARRTGMVGDVTGGGIPVTPGATMNESGRLVSRGDRGGEVMNGHGMGMDNGTDWRDRQNRMNTSMSEEGINYGSGKSTESPDLVLSPSEEVAATQQKSSYSFMSCDASPMLCAQGSGSDSMCSIS
eukprot:scaffold144133_cov50-Attheya_sp.AAC.2